MDISEYDWYGYGPLEAADVRLEDVGEFVHWHEGINEQENWMGVLRMKDGRWCYIESWCDYTGFDCQGGGEAFYASSEDELVRNCLTAEARHAFGYEVPPDCGV